MAESRLFFEHARFSIYCSIVFGLSPICLSKKENSPTTIIKNPLWQFISAGYLLFNLLLVAIILMDYSDIRRVTSLNNYGFTSVAYMTYSCKVACNAVHFFLLKFAVQDGVKKILLDLTETDNILQEFNIHRSYMKDMMYQMFHVLTAPVFFIIVIVTQNIIVKDFALSTPALLFEIQTFIMASMADADFIMLLLVIKQNFSFINKCLSDFVDTKEKKLSDIKIMMYLYGKNCEVASDITYTYGPSVILITGIHLGELLLYVFYAYEGKELKLHNLTICAGVVIAIKVFEITRRYTIGHLTADLANVAKHLVHKALLQTKDTVLMKELMIFSKQLLHSHVRITACGVFPIDGESVSWTVGFAPPLMLIIWTYQQNSAAVVHCRNIPSTVLKNTTDIL